MAQTTDTPPAVPDAARRTDDWMEHTIHKYYYLALGIANTLLYADAHPDTTTTAEILRRLRNLMHVSRNMDRQFERAHPPKDVSSDSDIESPYGLDERRRPREDDENTTENNTKDTD